ncbi:MAG: L,D-transpeptidase family protein [Candidatus Moranbacteria bacterium]|nr:L,D-transpeptidase family protein [Candidatus Moranbacteria bacterium]
MKKKGSKLEFFTSWFLYVIICFAISYIFFNLLSTHKNELLIPKTTYSLDHKENIKPDSDIHIKFNQPVKPYLIKKSFKISPGIKGDLFWEEDLTGFKFIPQEIFSPNQKYTLTFQGESSLFVPFKNAKEFRIEEYPQIVKVSPYKDQGVKVDEKIFIDFNKSTADYELEFKVGIPLEKNPIEQTDQKTPTISTNEKFSDIESPIPQINEKDINNYVTLIDFDIDHNEDKTEYVLTPKKPLELNQKYKVVVSQKYTTDKEGSQFKTLKEFSFATLEPLNFVESYPKGGTRDVSTDQKFTITFDKPFKEESLRDNLKITPPTPYKIEFSQNKKTAVVIPENFKQDTNYKILLKEGLKAQNDSYLKEDVGIEFITGNKGGFVRDGRSSIDDPFFKDGKYIDVNLSTQLMSIYNDGILLGTYKVSTGKRGMATPTGTYAVLRKERRHWSHQYKLWMPYSLAFTGAGHYIHELPEWPNGYKEGQDHLGIPVSHGCIRLGVGPAEVVFNFSDVGTPIYIHY